MNPDDKPTWIVYPSASDEPLDVIRVNECEAFPDLATRRSQRLWNEIERLRVALKAARWVCTDCGKKGGHEEYERCPARDESYF